MSETPIYFFLAQVNSLMTGALRLSLAADLLLIVVLLGSFFAPHWSRLGLYFGAWGSFYAAVGLLSAALLKNILPYQNPFVNQGVYTAVALLLGGLLVSVLLRFSLERRVWRIGLAGLSALALAGVCLWPAFSRSDKTLMSVLMALPVAIAIAYLPLLFSERYTKWQSALHLLWGLSLPWGLVVYYVWIFPFLKGIPQAGEFYPFINLYDWILMLFVILYSGNIYIDYWLKDRKVYLAVGWHYLVFSLAIVCHWLNANIFDTLAL